jgi:hypothetical protein
VVQGQERGYWEAKEVEKGRPRLTRMEDVGMYLRNMGVKRRRARTLEGREWASKEL